MNHAPDAQSSPGRQDTAPARRAFSWGDLSARALAFAAMTAALSWPAIANRFPIIFYDTGGYLARPFEGTFLLGRSAFYGALLAAGAPADFWPVVALQSAATAWLILLTLRAHRFPGGLGSTLAVVLGLSVLTGLPWYSAQLMPDIMTSWLVLALYLLAFRADALSRGACAGLIAMVAVALPSHMATLALAVVLVVALILWRLMRTPPRLQCPTLRLPLIAVAAGVLLCPVSNAIIVGQFAFTPGGMNFIFSRLVQDGVVQHYLDTHCPDATLKICAYKDELPKSADDWLWDEPSPLFKLGGSEAFEPEARRIVLATLALYPWTHLKDAVKATAQQFVFVATGDGLTPWTWHAQWMLERFAPQSVRAYLGARQQQAEFDFSWLNAVHIPVALFALAGLALVGTRAWRKGERETASRAVFILGALLANAAICGTLSNPHDRYQSRLVWIAPFCLLLSLRKMPTAPEEPDVRR